DPRPGPLLLSPAPSTHISPLSLHDALPISACCDSIDFDSQPRAISPMVHARPTNEHPRRGGSSPCLVYPSGDVSATRRQSSRPIDRKSTRLNQSRENLVCRLLLEKKKKEKG